MKTINIDPAGDMYLVASGGDEPVSFLVCSKVLTLASGVLAALLGPNFREGNVLAQATTPPEIALPADDAIGMEMLLKVIHHQEVQSYPQNNDLVALARVVDKYQCQYVFRARATTWLADKIRGMGAGNEVVELLGVAIAFDVGQIVSAITLDLTITTGRSFNAKTTKDRIKAIPLVELVPLSLCRAVDSLRKTLHRHLTNELFAVWKRAAAWGQSIHLGSDRTSRHHEAVLTSFFDHLQTLGIIPEEEDYATPLLTRCTGLAILATRIKKDSNITSRFTSSKKDCQGCTFLAKLDMNFCYIWMDTVGGQEGMSIRSDGEYRVEFNADAVYSDEGREVYSPAFKLLFEDSIGYTIGSYNIGQTFEDWKAYLAEERGYVAQVD